MRITGGRVFADGVFAAADVLIEQDRFSGVNEPGRADSKDADGEVVDATGCYVVPGFIDLHFHGCMAADCCDGSVDAFSTLARYEASRGVTAICPATMTYPESFLADIMDAAHDFEPAADEAALDDGDDDRAIARFRVPIDDDDVLIVDPGVRHAGAGDAEHEGRRAVEAQKLDQGQRIVFPILRG